MRVAENLRAAVAERVIATGASDQLRVSASFGVASLDGQPIDLDELMRRADKALYSAKTAGRNQCSMWESGAPPGMGNIMRRVLKAGQIAFNAGRSMIDCTVRALSEAGASLDVVSTAGIPDTFKLLIHSDKIARQCNIVTKMNKRIEVVFQ
jgi:hypothetical protein